MIPTYCFLRIPNLPALLSQRKLPVCPHRPLAVVTDTGERGVVRSASPEALALGVRPGQLVRQLRRFNGTLDLIPEQPEERLSIVRELTAMLKGYTPAVQAKGEDCFLLDLTGTGRLWGSPARVGRELLDRLTHEWRLAASIGIGPTRTLARIASAVTSAPGLREVTRPEAEQFLHPLSVDSLPGVGSKTRERLYRYGWRTVGELAALPRELLVETFGGYRGVLLARLARGEDIGSLRVRKEVSTLHREMPLPEDTLDADSMEAFLGCLCGRLALDLRKRKLAARRITVRVQYADGLSRQMNRSLPAATGLEIELGRAARALLEELLPLRRVRVAQLGVSVSRLRPLAAHRTLFDVRGMDRHEAVAEEVFQIRSRYGFNSMVFGRVHAAMG